MLSIILHILVLGLLVHIIPNLLMKVVKVTSVGHKILTAFFQLGLEGKELSKLTLDLMNYVVGPESLVEYHLGRKLRFKLSNEAIDINIAIDSFKSTLKNGLVDFDQDELKLAKDTPFMSTLVIFANEDISKYVSIIEKICVRENSKRTFINLTVYTILILIALVVDPIAMLQPVICVIRKKIGTSAFGKKVLKNNFNKGFKGNNFGRLYGLFIDLFIAPSVLDTQRLGLFLNKYNVIEF